MLFKDVSLRIRRALSQYKVCGDITLLVLNGASLNRANALLALSRLYGISSVESQKGIIADQRCSVENQKGAIAIGFVQR